MKLKDILEQCSELVDGKDDSLYCEIQLMISNIENFESEFLSKKASEDCSLDTYRSDGECLDEIIEILGLEVERG